MLINDQVVCIRTVDYSETSQVITFLTKQTGKITLMAKGSKRTRWPFGGPIEIFSCGRAVFTDSGRDKLGTLVEFEPMAGVTDSSVIAADYFVLNCCLFALELVNLLTKDYDPHPGLFDVLIAFLHDAGHHKSPETNNKKTLALLVLFQLNLLREIGLTPVFEFCVNCKNPFSMGWPEVRFSNNAKGLICRDCQGAFHDGIRLTKQAAQCFTDTQFLASADDKVVNEVEGVLVRYFTDAIGRPLKMAKYIVGR